MVATRAKVIGKILETAKKKNGSNDSNGRKDINGSNGRKSQIVPFLLLPNDPLIDNNDDWSKVVEMKPIHPILEMETLRLAPLLSKYNHRCGKQSLTKNYEQVS